MLNHIMDSLEFLYFQRSGFNFFGVFFGGVGCYSIALEISRIWRSKSAISNKRFSGSFSPEIINRAF